MSNIMTKEYLEAHKEILEDTISKMKELSDINSSIDFSESISNLEYEKECVDKILELPEESYDGLYGTGSDDIIMLAEELQAKEDQLSNDVDGIEFIMEDSLDNTINQVETLENIEDNPDKVADDIYNIMKKESIDAGIPFEEIEKNMLQNAKEHPIKTAIKGSLLAIGDGFKVMKQGIVDSISISSKARTQCFQNEYEYNLNKNQAYNSVIAMGNSGHHIISPIRQVTLDTIEMVMDKVTEGYKKTMKGFGKFCEIATEIPCNNKLVCNCYLEVLSLGLYSYLRSKNTKLTEKNIERDNLKIEKWTKIKNNHPDNDFIQSFAEEKISYWSFTAKLDSSNYESIWPTKSGKSPVHMLVDTVKEKFNKDNISEICNNSKELCKDLVDNAVTKLAAIKEAGENFIADCLIYGADRCVEIEKKISQRKSKYEKASEELGKFEKNLLDEVGPILNVEAYQAKEFDPNEKPQNAEMAKQIKAIEQMYPDEKVMSPILKIYKKELEYKLHKEEKAFNKNEQKVEKTDIKLKDQLTKNTKSEIRGYEKNIRKANKKISKLEAKSGTFKRLENYLRTKSEEIKPIISNEIDKNKLVNAIYNKKDIDGENLFNITTATGSVYTIDTVNKTIQGGHYLPEKVDFDFLSINENGRMDIIFKNKNICGGSLNTSEIEKIETQSKEKENIEKVEGEIVNDFSPVME